MHGPTPKSVGSAESRRHSQTTLTAWFNLYRQGGIDGLLEQKQRGKGFAPELDERQMQELAAELKKGRWCIAKEAYVWLKERFGVKFSLPHTYRCLKKLGGRLKVTRPSHTKKTRSRPSPSKKHWPKSSWIFNCQGTVR